MATDIPPPSPQPTRWIAATCILGAVVIALVATLAIRTASSGDVGESADGSAGAACAVLEQIPDDGFEDPASDDARINMMRLSSAVSIGMLAAEQDDSFQDLSEAFIEPQRVGGTEFDYNGDGFVSAIGDARDACADEGF